MNMADGEGVDWENIVQRKCDSSLVMHEIFLMPPWIPMNGKLGNENTTLLKGVFVALPSLLLGSVQDQKQNIKWNNLLVDLAFDLSTMHRRYHAECSNEKKAHVHLCRSMFLKLCPFIITSFKILKLYKRNGWKTEKSRDTIWKTGGWRVWHIHVILN